MPRGKPNLPTDPETGRKIITDVISNCLEVLLCGTGVSKPDPDNPDVPDNVLLANTIDTLKSLWVIGENGPYRKMWLHWHSEWEYNELHLMGERLESDDEYEMRLAANKARRETTRKKELAKAKALPEKHDIPVPDEVKGG